MEVKFAGFTHNSMVKPGPAPKSVAGDAKTRPASSRPSNCIASPTTPGPNDGAPQNAMRLSPTRLPPCPPNDHQAVKPAGTGTHTDWINTVTWALELIAIPTELETRTA